MQASAVPAAPATIGRSRCSSVGRSSGSSDHRPIHVLLPLHFNTATIGRSSGPSNTPAPQAGVGLMRGAAERLLVSVLMLEQLMVTPSGFRDDVRKFLRQP